jgi:hypothetical protein
MAWAWVYRLWLEDVVGLPKDVAARQLIRITDCLCTVLGGEEGPQVGEYQLAQRHSGGRSDWILRPERVRHSSISMLTNSTPRHHPHSTRHVLK